MSSIWPCAAAPPRCAERLCLSVTPPPLHPRLRLRSWRYAPPVWGRGGASKRDRGERAGKAQPFRTSGRRSRGAIWNTWAKCAWTPAENSTPDFSCIPPQIPSNGGDPFKVFTRVWIFSRLWPSNPRLFRATGRAAGRGVPGRQGQRPELKKPGVERALSERSPRKRFTLWR